MEKNIITIINKLQLASIKIQMFHWNVVGKDFLSYHEFFDDAYKELSGHKDTMAEFLRYKKELALIDFEWIAKTGKGFKLPKDAKGMLAEMLEDYKEIEKDFVSLEKDEVLDAIVSAILPDLEKRIFFTQSILENY